MSLGPAAFAADDAHALLAKARAAFLENREHARYWNWTIKTDRRVVDKDGTTLDELPSVTVESPIRSDGRRCNAVLSWGDGREPYLANADADARCTVEQEVQDRFKVEALLQSRLVKVRAHSANQIILETRADTEAAESTDLVKRCIASTRSRIDLDARTYFPKTIDIEVVGTGCEGKTAAVDHYDNQAIPNAQSSFRKGSTERLEYARQEDKAGNVTKDYWICVGRSSARPLRAGATVLIFWGRRFQLTSSGDHRTMLVTATTRADELATDALLKFETDPKKDK